MRLGVLLDRLDPRLGGAEAHTDALVRRALAQGEQVVVAALEGRAPDGAETLLVRAPRRRPARDRVFAADGERALRARGCDVVLALRHATACDVYLPHGGLVDDALHAHDAALGPAGPLTRLVRTLSRKRRFFADAERALLGAPDGPRVIALSQRLAERIAARFPAARARTVVIPNGVDVAWYDRRPFEAGREGLRTSLGLAGAYVGLLVAHRPRLKGLDTALHAMAHPRAAALAPAFHLVVVGRHVEPASRRLARRLGVEERVHWHGLVDDPRPLYAAADVLVQPTFHDPCSLTTLEALSMSLPVITTSLNGVSELMGRRGGIPLEAPGDPEALATALAVLADPALRRFTAEDARYVAEKNRLGTRLDQVLDVLRAAAGRVGA